MILTLDFEATNLPDGPINPDNRLLLAVYSYDGRVYHKWGSEYEQGHLVSLVQKCSMLVAHYAKYELQWLKRCGVDVVPCMVYDTMIGEVVLHANDNRYRDLSLEAMAIRYNTHKKEGYINKLMKAGVCPSEMPPKWLHRRCLMDVMSTIDIFNAQRRQLNETNAWHVMSTRMRTTKVLADIEWNGMCPDKDSVIDEHRSISMQRDVLKKELDQITGGINLNSPPQTAEFLYDILKFDEIKGRDGRPVRTPTNRRKADDATISALKAKTKQQSDFIKLYREYKGLATRLSKILNPLAKCAGADDILRFSFKQTTAVTQRLSSAGGKYGIQGQNIPRIYKKLFKPRHLGWYIVEVDESQLEFRVAVHQANDSTGKRDIREKVDIHSISAKHLGVTRQEAKEFTFKPLYGGTSGTKKQQAYFEHFLCRYSAIKNKQERDQSEVLATKKLTLETGLVLYFPNARMDHRGDLDHVTRRAVCNYPVQNFASAEILAIALIALWEELKRRSMQSFIINTIHDSIILEVHPDELNDIIELCKWSCVDAVYDRLYEIYGIRFKTDLACEVKHGPRWSEGTEIKYTKETPYA